MNFQEYIQKKFYTTGNTAEGKHSAFHKMGTAFDTDREQLPNLCRFLAFTKLKFKKA